MVNGLSLNLTGQARGAPPEDVAEPSSAARHRTFIDTAARGRGERCGRLR
jgi:hypothetical protein